MAYDKKYMERAIELAKKGAGAVNPNPLVGAVIVKDGRVIGEGYHAQYGGLHAERQALENVTESPAGAELYVTLEPCNHTGKQPPCTDAILEAKIKRVYIGSDDPNPLVCGKGVWRLRSAGVEVITHVMKDECDALNKPFFHYITHKTPYIIYKYAMTMDGKICTSTGKSRWISNEASRKAIHVLRDKCTAIMVGIGTVLADDPMLNCRIEGGHDPIRIICDSHLRIPMDCNIVNTANEIKTYVAALKEIENEKKDKINALKDAGIGTLLLPADDFGHIDVNALVMQLGRMEIDSLLLEGGGQLGWSMFREDLIDEVYTLISPKVFGGTGASPVGGEGIDEVENAAHFTLSDTRILDGDMMLHYVRKKED